MSGIDLGAWVLALALVIIFCLSVTIGWLLVSIFSQYILYVIIAFTGVAFVRYTVVPRVIDE